MNSSGARTPTFAALTTQMPYLRTSDAVQYSHARAAMNRPGAQWGS